MASEERNSDSSREALENTSIPAATRWALPVALVGLILLIVLGISRGAPTPSKPANAPPAEFSAGRAIATLGRILEGVGPHPVGTAANTEVRKRLIREFEALGLSPEVQETFACSGWGQCAPVKNVLVRLLGRESGHAVMLTAHHDSVPAALGANDDGTGMASLVEVARALRQDPEPPRHSVLFVVSDAEEMGLIGAEGFAASHPWMEEIAAVLSLEARGAAGPAIMFETGPRSAGLVRVMARVCPRMIANSAAIAIYERLPNDTDLSVYKRADKPGLNFAYTGDVVHYHSALDDLEHAAADSTQHRGDCVLALTRSLANGELPVPVEEDLIFLDILKFGVIAWKEKLALPLAIFGTALLVAGMGLMLRAGALRLREVAWALLSQLLGAIAAGLGVSAWVAALRAFTGHVQPWTAAPTPSVVALLAVSLALLAVPVVWLRKRAGFWGYWSGFAILTSVGALAIAAMLPGASPGQVLTVVPAGLAVWLSGAALRPASGSRAVITVLVPLVPVGIFQLLLATSIHRTLGLGFPLLIAFLLIGVVAALSPLLCVTRRPFFFPGIAAIVAVVATVGALLVPSVSKERPGLLNIVFHQDADTGATAWIVEDRAGRVPSALVMAGGLAPGRESPMPFYRADASWIGEARPESAPGPTLDVLSDTRDADGDTRTLRVRLRSPRGAPQASLMLPPGSEPLGVLMNGARVPPNPDRLHERLNGWTSLRCLGLPPEGVEITFRLPHGEPVGAIVTDQSYGLPAQGRSLLEARPPEWVPKHGGDQWWISRRVRL